MEEHHQERGQECIPGGGKSTCKGPVVGSLGEHEGEWKLLCGWSRVRGIGGLMKAGE